MSPTIKILEMMHADVRADNVFLGNLKAGAREFIGHLIAEEDHIVQSFVYSRESDAMPNIADVMHSIRPASELPSAILTYRKSAAANKTVSPSGGSRGA